MTRTGNRELVHILAVRNSCDCGARFFITIQRARSATAITIICLKVTPSIHRRSGFNYLTSVSVPILLTEVDFFLLILVLFIKSIALIGANAPLQ